MKMEKYEDLLGELIELSKNVSKTQQESQAKNEKLQALVEKLKALIEFMDENAMDLASVIGDLSEDKQKLEHSGLEILGEFGTLNENYKQEKANLLRAIKLLEENGIEIAKNFGELYEEKMKLEKNVNK